MEFKKCDRCGCFFASADSVCHNCLTKERFEMSKFKTYIEENNISNINSLNELSIGVGIPIKTLNRFLSNDDFLDISKANKMNLEINNK